MSRVTTPLLGPCSLRTHTCRSLSGLALIRSGANVDELDAFGRTPLRRAAANCSPSAASALVLCNAKLDLVGWAGDVVGSFFFCHPVLSPHFTHTSTPLFQACRIGKTPASAAVRFPSTGVLDVLLAAGLPLSAVPIPPGYTPTTPVYTLIAERQGPSKYVWGEVGSAAALTVL